jgi:zona occludens toxin
LALAGVACVWAFWPEPDKPKAAVKRPGAIPQVPSSSTGHNVAWVVSDPVGAVTGMVGKQASDQPTGTNELPEPYGLKGLHVVGQITMKGKTVAVLAVSQNGMQITTVTSSELEQVGYKWKALTDCAGSLQWKEKVRALTCDSPQITMALQRAAPTATPVSQGLTASQ